MFCHSFMSQLLNPFWQVAKCLEQQRKTNNCAGWFCADLENLYRESILAAVWSPFLFSVSESLSSAVWLQQQAVIYVQHVFTQCWGHTTGDRTHPTQRGTAAPSGGQIIASHFSCYKTGWDQISSYWAKSSTTNDCRCKDKNVISKTYFLCFNSYYKNQDRYISLL